MTAVFFLQSLLYYYCIWTGVYLFGALVYKSVVRVLFQNNLWNPGVSLPKADDLAWNLYTRFLSSIHASVVAYHSLSIINNDYALPYNNISPSSDSLYDKLFFAYGEILPRGVDRFDSLTGFMVSYLIVDCAFLLTMRTEKDILGNLLHHVFGSIGMAGFAHGNRFHFNGLYYMLTEITTPSLNLSWAILHCKAETTDLGKTVLVVSGAITWVLFLLVRFLGGIWLFFMVYHNMDTLLTYDYWEIIVAFTVNPLICGLNWWWFYKLTRIVFGINDNKTVRKMEKRE